MRLALIFLFVARICFAGSEVSSTDTFKDLDGVAREPMNPGNKVASVLIFFWQDCPISNSYVPELNRLAASQTNFAFYVVQVDPELTAEAARAHAREYALHLPVLLDPKHELANRVKATVTPEAVVVGKDGQVLYRGRIDDRYAALENKRAAITQHDLLAALEAIAHGNAVKERETKAIGCLIE